jgi:hypothetical protein
MFFFEKKNQKLLRPCGLKPRAQHARIVKLPEDKSLFTYLSSEKKFIK